MKKSLFVILIIVSSVSVFSQKNLNLDELAEKHTLKSMPLLYDLLSIPNDANFPEDIEKNIVWCEKEFQNRQFKTTRIETETVPLLLAERNVKKAKKTVLIYLQIDGQPVDTSKWHQANPYTPALKKPFNDSWEEIDWSNITSYEDDWRVFARSASDAKGPAAMFLAAIDAIDENKINPNFNMKVIMDFEEELGSPRLPKAVMENKELLKSDMLVIFDGPMHITNEPTLVFGARGIATATLTTYGPIVPQHSGHYGNYAPNPALRLAKLLASMKDDNGRVIIPGYYDGIELDETTQELLQAVPDDEEEIKERLQIAGTDNVGTYYQESIQYPSLNIRGMQSGWIDEEARTIVPSWARAELDLRLVLESDPERLISLIEDHIVEQGYYVIDRKPTKEERLKYDKIATFTHEVSYQSFRTDYSSEVGVWLRKALIKAFDKEPIMERMAGGSIPISPFVVTLGIPAVLVPTVNRDNNQHSPNENLRLGNYRLGIKSMISILSEEM
ncbi:MAG: M20/M25/M40 family metallo-hydrolase [Fulvivirga sp.]|uniref:M20/M25/M40 family metallo-hydrolase n=1 Tax=Fulvivirga sp. TaxID=1931237 RepID=UPI0032ECEAD8